MSNENQGGARKSMGQLFVDLGIGGLGKTLAALGAVKLGFNVARKAGEQLTKPFKELISDSSSFAVNAGKMAKSLGATTVQVLQLKRYLQKFNLNESLIGDIGNLRTMFYNLHHGLGGISGEVAGALNQIGMSVFDNDGTFQGTLDFIEKVRERTKNLSDEDRNSILQRLGISDEWGYAWEKGGFNLNDYKTISEEEVLAIQKAEEAINAIKADLQTLGQKYLAELAPTIKDIAEKLDKYLGDTSRAKNDIDNAAKGAAKIVTTSADATYMGGLAGISAVTRKAPEGVAGILKAISKSILTNKNELNSKGKPTGGAAGISLSDTPLVGDMSNYNPLSQSVMRSVSNQSNTINITNNQNIQGSNAQEIANKIQDIDLAQIERTQYQTHNMAGL